jgi:hypothetical protein
MNHQTAPTQCAVMMNMNSVLPTRFAYAFLPVPCLSAKARSIMETRSSLSSLTKRKWFTTAVPR